MSDDPIRPTGPAAPEPAAPAVAPAAPQDAPPSDDPVIAEPMMHFTNIPAFRDGEGRVWTDELWAYDLEAHHRHEPNLMLCCPVEPLPENPQRLSRLAFLEPEGRLWPVRRDYGWGSVLRNIPHNRRAVRQAAAQARIWRTGGAGWAIPLSYWLLGAHRAQGAFWHMNIESSTWRMLPGRRPGLRQFLEHHFHLWMHRRCLRAADWRSFTQKAYREEMLGETERSFISVASWFSEKALIPEAALEERLAARARGEGGRLRAIYPARLVAEKGVETVLAAADLLAARGAEIEIDLIGEGPLEGACRAAAAKHAEGPTRVRFLDQVPYGRPFFDLIGGYDIGLVANRQAEQPRIIFDLFSQGLAVLATRTDGVQEVVEDGRDSLLVSVDDAQAMADALAWLAADPAALIPLRRAGRAGAQSRTHEDMHRRRTEALIEELARWKAAGGA